MIDMSQIRRSAPVSIVTITAILALSACSASIGSQKTVSKEDVETQGIQQLAANAGVPVDNAPKLSCPDDLKAEVGATLTCSLGTAPAKVYDVTVTVTSVDSKTEKAKFDLKVAKTPRQ